MKLPFEKLEKKLANGMQVILIGKPDYARSLFMIGIPAGGLNVQEAGKTYRTGSAHFLEHQMFRLHGQDVTPIFASMQAQTNAFTSYTETCYFFATSADPLPPLKVLIDFVQNLDITDESVKKEKGIILSEYNIYDNSPENRLLKSAFKALYQNHPFKEDILGTPQDISEMQVSDLQDFYNTYYDPSQLVLVGVTGRELEPIMDFIEKQEAAYPCKVPGSHERVFPAEPEETAKERMEIEMDLQRPYALLGVKLKPSGTLEDNVRTDYMINLWLDSVFSLLNPAYQTWLNEHLITQNSGAEADLMPDHAYVLIYSQTDQPEEFLKLAKSLLAHPQPMDPEVFEALKIQNMANGLRVADDFDQMASNAVRGYFGKYDPWMELDVIEKTTLEEVNEFIASLDFTSQSEIIIKPKAGIAGSAVQEDAEERSADQSSAPETC